MYLNVLYLTELKAQFFIVILAINIPITVIWSNRYILIMARVPGTIGPNMLYDKDLK